MAGVSWAAWAGFAREDGIIVWDGLGSLFDERFEGLNICIDWDE